jgi:hypothetical protein
VELSIQSIEKTDTLSSQVLVVHLVADGYDENLAFRSRKMQSGAKYTIPANLTINDVLVNLFSSDSRMNIEETKFYSVKDNWTTIAPFMRRKDMLDSVARSMGFLDSSAFEDSFKEPWHYWGIAFFAEIITERTESDPDYKACLKSIERHYHFRFEGDNYNSFDDLFFIVHNYFFVKHKPQLYSYDWFHGYGSCHFTAFFVLDLLDLMFPAIEHIGIASSSTHSIVVFQMEHKVYILDWLLEWGSLKELSDFFETVTEYLCFR